MKRREFLRTSGISLSLAGGIGLPIIASGEVSNQETIIDFAKRVNIILTPVQEFIFKAIYGLPLDRIAHKIPVVDILGNSLFSRRFTEIEFLNYLYNEGMCNTKNVGEGFRESIFISGRRSGKSLMGSLMESYEINRLLSIDDVCKHYDLLTDSEIAVLSVTPCFDQSRVFYGYTLQRLEQIGVEFRNKTIDYATMGSGGNRIRYVSSFSNSNLLRGKAAICVHFDEFAFFDQSIVRDFTAEDLYKALTPSTAGFGNDGKVFITSSAFGNDSYLYKLYTDSFDRDDVLMFKLPSALSNNLISQDALLKASKSDSFACEFGSRFIGT